ncbi:hypothetical protein ACFPYM_00840 [Methylobacterium hispanicum]|nr:hypothetical protein [Methylobacterium hispanicum]
MLSSTPKACASWLEALTEETLRLQRPLPDDLMREVARGER